MPFLRMKLTAFNTYILLPKDTLKTKWVKITSTQLFSREFHKRDRRHSISAILGNDTTFRWDLQLEGSWPDIKRGHCKQKKFIGLHNSTQFLTIKKKRAKPSFN